MTQRLPTPAISARRLPVLSGQRGFTLIEIMVVVVIVAIMATTVAVSFSGGDRDRRLQVDAQRVASLLELTRTQALQRSEEWGVLVEESSISFSSFDEDTREWVAYDQRPFRELSIEDVRFELYVDEQLEMPEQYEEGEVPDLVFFSSGESQNYKLRLQPKWEGLAWSIESDGLSSAELTRLER